MVFVFTSTEEISEAVKIGQTTEEFALVVNGVKLFGQDVQVLFEGKLEEVYPQNLNKTLL